MSSMSRSASSLSSTRYRMPVSALDVLADPLERLGGGPDFAFLDLAIRQGQYLQKRERLLCLFIAHDILQHGLGFAMQRDHDRLVPLGQAADHLGGVRLEVADGFHPLGKL